MQWVAKTNLANLRNSASFGLLLNLLEKYSFLFSQNIVLGVKMSKGRKQLCIIPCPVDYSINSLHPQALPLIYSKPSFGNWKETSFTSQQSLDFGNEMCFYWQSILWARIHKILLWRSKANKLTFCFGWSFCLFVCFLLFLRQILALIVEN